MTPVDKINDKKAQINRQLKSALNNFFKKYPDLVEGCILRKNWDDAPYVLIIESSEMYEYMQGFCGWTIHTDFYNAFKQCSYKPDMINSCEIGFWE